MRSLYHPWRLQQEQHVCNEVFFIHFNVCIITWEINGYCRGLVFNGMSHCVNYTTINTANLWCTD